MANKTVKDAVAVHGSDPQHIIDAIVRQRIRDSIYWKEECFALTAERVVDKAMALKYVGGVYGGNVKPTPFLCLVLKLLQIQPEKEIIMEFIRQEEFKYVRALGAFYFRLVATAKEIFGELEPLYKDYRKILFQDRMGKFEVIHVDEFIDRVLREER
ncbi:hypothetical protein RvY_05009-2 [Ramazzottius varieornatus]|nr:hypothetical protein RvY_05009-2 [Ramazzottius varieornatus]